MHFYTETFIPDILLVLTLIVLIAQLEKLGLERTSLRGLSSTLCVSKTRTITEIGLAPSSGNLPIVRWHLRDSLNLQPGEG